MIPLSPALTLPPIAAFVRYLLKGSLVLGEERDALAFAGLHRASIRHMRHGPWFVDVNARTGNVTNWEFNALQAFFPGLQVLAGEVTMAQETAEAYADLWDLTQGTPERWSIRRERPASGLESYQLRPELVESAWSLDRATGSPAWRDLGRRVLGLLERTKTRCGYAPIANVTSFQGGNVANASSHFDEVRGEA